VSGPDPIQLFADFRHRLRLQLEMGLRRMAIYIARLAAALSECCHCRGWISAGPAILKVAAVAEDIQWLVASSARLPVTRRQPGRRTMRIQPWSWGRVLRTLKPGGQVLP